jgi:solute carrier family 15 oligopeptide transporter 1
LGCEVSVNASDKNQSPKTFFLSAILSLYLRDILLFGEHSATVIYHTFIMIAYFFPIIGAIISDNYLGKFKTIFYISLIYACGNIILAAASAKPFGLAQIPFSLLGLFLIAFGTGGIKPCVAPFGGDQFVLPQQQAHLEKFFSMLYFSVNSGSLLSTLVTPILRGEVHCCGENSCYPLAFSLPAVLMVIAIGN